MAAFKFAIKKESLSVEQISLIRIYKTFWIPPSSYVEEYQLGFKFYIDESANVDNIIDGFVSQEIYPIIADFFKEEWYY